MSTVTRIRRRVARWAAPDVFAELRATKRKLRHARGELRDVRARLTERSYALPPEVEDTISRVRAEHLTYLKPDGLRALAAGVREAETQQLPGLVIEAGTALGGSAIVMAVAKSPRYEQIAGGQATGVGGATYYGYRDDLYETVTDSFARLGVPVGEHNVELIKGLFEDTIELDEPVALAHLDGDWYESTMTCLERIAPLLVPGGRIVLDDYYKWSGCRTAVDEYFADRPGFQLEHGPKLHVIRTPDA
jgi:hypothetical protein